MKITQSDVDDIMKSIRSTGAPDDRVGSAIMETIGKLDVMLTKSIYWQELSTAISTSMMAHSIQTGKTGIQDLAGNSAQMGLMTGALLGFQLGLREAGLEMGIASTPDFGKPTDKK
jgi:hypothetical protein